MFQVGQQIGSYTLIKDGCNEKVKRAAVTRAMLWLAG
jgi:hypothetical protein